jgi:hypothetical protein
LCVPLHCERSPDGKWKILKFQYPFAQQVHFPPHHTCTPILLVNPHN